MTKIDDPFIQSSLPNKSDISYGIKGTSFPYNRAPHTENPHIPSFSRFEVFPHTQTFLGKHEPLYSTQYSDLFVTYQEGFNMHTGKPNPQSMNNEYISGKILLALQLTIAFITLFGYAYYILTQFGILFSTFFYTSIFNTFHQNL